MDVSLQPACAAVLLAFPSSKMCDDGGKRFDFLQLGYFSTGDNFFSSFSSLHHSATSSISITGEKQREEESVKKEQDTKSLKKREMDKDLDISIDAEVDDFLSSLDPELLKDVEMEDEDELKEEEKTESRRRRETLGSTTFD